MQEYCNIIATMSHVLTFTPEPVTLADQAYETLRERILAGELPGGMRLRQHQLARDLGITTNPLREALVRLSRDGLVDMEPNMGAKVREWKPEDFIRQLDVRIALEGELAMFACERITPPELRELARRSHALDCHILNPQEDLMRIYSDDIEIHRLIARASRSEALVKFWEVAIVQPKHSRPQPYWEEHVKQCQPWSHMMLVKAIASRDPNQARDAARKHIAYSRAIDIRILGLAWQFPQYQADAVPEDVDEDQFRNLLEG